MSYDSTHNYRLVWRQVSTHRSHCCWEQTHKAKKKVKVKVKVNVDLYSASSWTHL